MGHKRPSSHFRKEGAAVWNDDTKGIGLPRIRQQPFCLRPELKSANIRCLV